MNVEIVPIAPEHISGFRTCLDVVAKERRYLAQIEAPPLHKVREFVEEGLSKNVAQFVALDGETVVGWADVFPHWAQAVAHRGRLGMGVLPEYRGQGIGTRLLSACIAKARDNGLTRIELEVRADNTAAIALYERLGFAHEGRHTNALRFDDAYFDAFGMGLILT